MGEEEERGREGGGKGAKSPRRKTDRNRVTKREARWGAGCWEGLKKVTSGPLKEPQTRGGEEKKKKI